MQFLHAGQHRGSDTNQLGHRTRLLFGPLAGRGAGYYWETSGSPREAGRNLPQDEC